MKLEECQVQFILGIKVHENGLGDEQICGMTLASAYVLHHLSAA